MELKIRRALPTDPDFKFLVVQLDKELEARYGEEQKSYNAHNIIDHNGSVIVAYQENEPIACGCFRKMDDGAIEIKRMFTVNACRGKGIAKKILMELERWAAEEGFHTAKLETGIAQPEAIAVYRKSGYSLIDNYGPYADKPSSVCMQKSLK